MRKKLLTNGNVFKRTDGRWGGVVWYMDEQGNRKRKSTMPSRRYIKEKEPKPQAEKRPRWATLKPRQTNGQCR